MKKLLLALVVTATFSSSVFASNAIYFRADVGRNKFNNTRGFITDYAQKISGQYNGNTSISLDVGCGYQMNQHRFEFVWSTDSSKKRTITSNEYPVPRGDTMNIYDVTATPNIQTFMLKTYTDVMDFDKVKVFVGAGLGISRITVNHKGSYEYSGAGSFRESRWYIPEKGKTNLTYSMAIGSSVQLAKDIIIDLQYNYQDFGKSSGKAELHYTSIKAKSKYSAHAIKCGARFPI